MPHKKIIKTPVRCGSSWIIYRTKDNDVRGLNLRRQLTLEDIEKEKEKKFFKDLPAVVVHIVHHPTHVNEVESLNPASRFH
jgi:hypothetical protein